MRKLAVAISNNNKWVNPIESIDAVKNAGFENVFLQWYDKPWVISQQEQLDYCRKVGLNVIFVHLGYQDINNIWLDNELGEHLVSRFKRNLLECKVNGIALVVMHLTSKSEAPGPNEIGLKRLTEIVEYAKELGIRIAFENTKMKGYLEYVIDNIPAAGICLDVGHLHAHFKDELPFEKFVDKIFAVHLHDNNGVNDDHLLPFDGTVNWEWVVTKLKECNYTGPVTMELVYQNDYINEDVVEFYTKGYEVGVKLANLFE